MKKIPYLIRISIAGIVLIFSIFAVYGIYPINIMDLQFAAVIQRMIINTSYIAVGIFIILIILTLLFGRFYCSCICPFGIIQEVFTLIFKKNNEPVKNRVYKYIISGITIGAVVFGGSSILIRYIEPYTIFTSAMSISIIGIIGVVFVLCIVFFKNRYFCTNICPIGAILGIISKISLNKIYMTDECISCGMCERNCPSGCIDAGENKVDNEICIKCLKCISVCPKNAIKYGRNRNKKTVLFNSKRREVIGCIAYIAAIGAGASIGLNIVKNVIKKVRNVIIPAGSVDTVRMQNKCLNCNLCINNCPNKILKKSDEKFSVVHIDYSYGKGYCEYECNKCSQVCPSGAIKRITLSEKQNTRIAMAMIKDDCMQCGHCIEVCPKGAIVHENSQPIRIDGSKCIGCGKCKKFCPIDAIDIFAVNEQTVI